MRRRVSEWTPRQPLATASAAALPSRPPHGKTSLSANKAAGIEARKSGETVEGESQGPIKDAKLPKGRSSLAATRPAGREAERSKSTVLGEGSNK
ncbi:MAG: hypothetical protein JWQ11_4809 [Rhizobacter sp.]|nr:hypothetical protein [Rhizobacter sp.]